MKLNKTNCLQLINENFHHLTGKKFRLKDMLGFESFSEKKNKHFSFCLSTENKNFAFRMCNYKSGTTYLLISVYEYNEVDDSYTQIIDGTQFYDNEGNITYDSVREVN